MKLLLLGATGRVGRELLRLALADGHDVVALVRSLEKMESVCRELERDARSNASLTIRQGDARSREDVGRALLGVDAVLCSLNTDGGTALSASMTVIVDAMQELGVRRIVTVGTAGILQSRLEPHLLRYRSSETRRTSTAAAEDHERTYHLLAASSLDWTLVCPTYLPEGPATGQYRVEREVLPEGGSRITTGDTAEFTYRQLTRDDFSKCRVGIAE
ncbi:NAD(P)-dependent oxidoreductase [Tumebacillus permanentifrigoris]|uniref:Putative NADH-flavin reductase n=1 Tax=Tumebacillus permanentifrigoris TaxID=378543 RepID=A0A316E0T8_9BACL|nr:SDR family oxidoreductase [Tumebacillus permanentifrigoris]PWK16430.1 putative NADH-flavin reductase [Tumebacillus permanentifrigoris]